MARMSMAQQLEAVASAVGDTEKEYGQVLTELENMGAGEAKNLGTQLTKNGYQFRVDVGSNGEKTLFISKAGA